MGEDGDDYESMDMSEDEDVEDDADDDDDDAMEMSGGAAAGGEARRLSGGGIAAAGHRSHARAQPVAHTPRLAVGDLDEEGIPDGGQGDAAGEQQDSSGDMSFSGVSGVSEFSPRQPRMDRS